jgi:hypothetical protein
MKLVVAHAHIVLMAEALGKPGQEQPVPDQTVEIHKAGDQAVIGIDGHTSRWDEQVEVRWEGSHKAQLENVSHVEIKDQGGVLVESLPLNGNRKPFEKDGETVFFLVDKE